MADNSRDACAASNRRGFLQGYNPAKALPDASMISRRRSLVAWIALLGIVFSQLALSAYACPQLFPANSPAQMESHGDMAGMPCGQMDTEQPLLCAQYGQQGHQTVGSNPWFDFHPVLGLLLVTPAVSQAGVPPESAVQAPLLARATSPPPLSRSRRLRI